MRALAIAALASVVWLGSTALSVGQSGGVIQFGPFQIPIFGGAPMPMGPFVVGPTTGRVHGTRTHGANPGGSPAGSRPVTTNRPAASGDSFNTVIGGSRVKF
jgi:hypothetical protein